MPKYSLIIQLGIRELTVNVRGIDVTVTQRLDRDPKQVQEVRAKVLAGRDELKNLISKKRNASGAATQDDTDKEIEALEAMVNQLDYALESDDRMTVCKAFSESIIKTDITDDEGNPLPLDVEGLYASDIPAEILQEILTAVREVPPAPKAK